MKRFELTRVVIGNAAAGAGLLVSEVYCAIKDNKDNCQTYGVIIASKDAREVMDIIAEANRTNSITDRMADANWITWVFNRDVTIKEV